MKDAKQDHASATSLLSIKPDKRTHTSIPFTETKATFDLVGILVTM